jgi:biopolymer transport protein ExbD
MIDVVFLLMIYFLLVAQFSKDERVHTLDVPRERAEAAAADPFALPVRAVRVLVRSLSDDPAGCALTTDSPLLRGAMTLDQLTLALENASRSTLAPDQRFIIAPSADAHWEHALATLTAIEDAGFSRVRYAPPQ